MQEDITLTRALLRKLSEIETLLPHGASKTIQPPVEGLHVPDPITVPGYDGKQIEYHLHLILERGYVSPGGVKDGPSIGIQFSHLTDAGHLAMKKTG